MSALDLRTPRTHHAVSDCERTYAHLHGSPLVEGATRHALANAHEKDLERQGQYGVHFLTYWFDETRSTAFCLVDAPDIESIKDP